MPLAARGPAPAPRPKPPQPRRSLDPDRVLVKLTNCLTRSHRRQQAPPDGVADGSGLNDLDGLRMSALSNKARAEPNLTPILDMVFQLITFFMLVINFKANMMDKAMELPIVGSARPIDKEDRRAFFMVNLNN